MYSLKDTLMKRDGLTEAEAIEKIGYAKERIMDGEDPEDVLADEFGLEPDYFFDLLID